MCVCVYMSSNDLLSVLCLEIKRWVSFTDLVIEADETFTLNCKYEPIIIILTSWIFGFTACH